LDTPSYTLARTMKNDGKLK